MTFCTINEMIVRAYQTLDLSSILSRREQFNDCYRNLEMSCGILWPYRQEIQHTIELKATTPIRLPPYRLPHAYYESVRQELREMENDGIIEQSTSEWAFPIVLVKKKDGTMRMCVDYRRLKEHSRTDAYPMPRVDDLIDSLGKSKYITTLDLARGYWQVPMVEDSRPLTAFVTPFGLYQFGVMPFGLNGAPATFQRLMDQVIRGLHEFSAAYLDDLIIFSSTWKDHLQHVQAVFDRLREAGLTAKPKKCQIVMPHCSYHIVGGGEIKPELSKIEAVQSFAVPTTKQQVRAFLGLTGYYWKFIRDYARVAATLTDLTKKAAPSKVVWSDICKTAFTTLKALLCSTPILKTPNFSKSFILQTDASERGIGAVLTQKDDTGEEHPVAYFSRKLLPGRKSTPLLKKNVWLSRSHVKHSEFTCWIVHSLFRRITVLYNG